MKNSLKIKLKLPGKRGKIYAQSIKVEAKDNSSKRSKVEIEYDEKDETLEIKIKASDLSALRAAMNTYLRWIIICEELLEN